MGGGEADSIGYSMFSEQKLLDALPGVEVKVSDAARKLNATPEVVVEVALRLQKKGCVRIRKPFLRERRILKLKPRYEEGTKVIAVMNLKGGVGKTVTALNLAACLAEMGHKTLIVDLDPQASATSALNIRAKVTVYGLLVGTRAPAKAVHKTAYDNLYIIPSELDLAGAETEVMGVDAAYRLWEALEWVKDDFKYVIIDCPPSLSMLSVNALTAANSVLVPVQCDHFALESLQKLMQTLELMKGINEDLHVEGILLTMYDPKCGISKQTAARVKAAYGSIIFDAVVGRDGAIGEAASRGIPLIYYDRECGAAKAYLELAKEVGRNGR